MVTDGPDDLRTDTDRPWPPPVGTAVSVTRPAHRYGAPRPWVRPVTVGSVVVLALVGGAWLLWAAVFHARPDVVSRVHSFEVVDAGTVSATIQIDRRPGVAATCLLEAQAADHGVVGEVVVEVPSGPAEQLIMTYEIPTERRATTVLGDCTSTDRAGSR